MKMYSTKYAMTAGIQEVEIDESYGGQDGKYFYDNANFRTQYVLGTDIFRERPEAVKRAKALRTNRISSLKRSIAKIEAMKFE